MAVYEQTYRPYEGPIGGAWARRLVIPRYALRQLFASKLFTILFVLAFVYPLGHAAYLYVVHNLGLFAKLGIHVSNDAGAALSLGAKQFQLFLLVQGLFSGMVLTLIAAPTMIARDLHNNGLALYLSRPLGKWEYTGGKFAVLALLLSAITWVPGLLLYVFNGFLEGNNWMFTHLRLAGAVFAGSWILITVFSLVGLAASALLRLRPVATIAIFGVLVVGAAFGAAINASLNTNMGDVFDILNMIQVAWAVLFGEALEGTLTSSPAVAAISLAGSCAISLMILSRRVRAYEVAR